MSKAYIRALLEDLRPYLKLNYFCKMIGLNQSTLSLWMKSPNNDYMISVDRLNELVSVIYQVIGKDFGNFA